MRFKVTRTSGTNYTESPCDGAERVVTGYDAYRQQESAEWWIEMPTIEALVSFVALCTERSPYLRGVPGDKAVIVIVGGGGPPELEIYDDYRE